VLKNATLASFKRRNTAAAAGEALLAQATVFIDWSDAANHGGRFARNQNDPRTPSRNMLSFPTGPMVNESGAGTPTKVTFVDGPDGPGTATRLTATANNQVFYLHRASNSPVPPAGTLSLRFMIIAEPGTGPHAFSFGLSTALQAGSALDLDWTNPANHAAATFFVDIPAYAASGDIMIRLTTSGAQVRIARLQFHDGALASMPAWSAEVFTGAHRSFKFANALTLDADGMLDTTGWSGGGWMLFPDLSPVAVTSYMSIHVGSYSELTTGSANYAHALHSNSGTGLTSATHAMGVENSAPYAGEATVNPTIVRSKMAANVVGKGVFIMAQVQTPTERRVYFEGIPALREAKVFNGFTARCVALNAYTTNTRAELPGLVKHGKSAYEVWAANMAPTEAEMQQVFAALRVRLAARGIALMDWDDFHGLSGDSNWTRATGDHTQLLTAAGFAAPGKDVIAAITAVGGEGLGDLECGNKDTWTGVITDAGRFRSIEKPMMEAATAAGKAFLYHPGMGTNDWQRINADRDAYIAHYFALCEEARAAGDVDIALDGIMPQYAPAPSAATAFETNRLYVNAAFAAKAAADPAHYWYTDFGVVQADLLPDGIHLDTALAAPFANHKVAAAKKATINAWRTFRGFL
jgi:hypothetical protein